MKQPNKSLVTSWSEDEEDDENKDLISNYVAFGARFSGTTESVGSYNSDGSMAGVVSKDECKSSYKELQRAYDDMHLKFMNADTSNKRLRSENAVLIQQVEKLSHSLEVLKLEKVILTDNLDRMTARAEESEKAIRRLNSGKASLEDALSMGQTSRHGLGYDKFRMERAKAANTVSTADHTIKRRARRCSYCNQ
jgi:chromosome segregation ATPase